MARTTWHLPEELVTSATLAALASEHGLMSGDVAVSDYAPCRLYPAALLLLAPDQPDPEALELARFGLARDKASPFDLALHVEQPEADVYEQLAAEAAAWGTVPFVDPVRAAADALRLGGPDDDEAVLAVSRAVRIAARAPMALDQQEVAAP